jgi:hypothetical protein
MITVGEFVGGARSHVSQPFGQTPYSRGAGAAKYAYCEKFCLPWGTHPGVDIGVPRGTRLYAPAAGKVIVAGATAFYQDERFGNAPHTGQLKIETDDRAHVIVGHMEWIAVARGQRVAEGDFIGRSGAANGDHVHVEVRIPHSACSVGLRCVDPMEFVFGEEPEPEQLRLFRITVEFLSAHDKKTVTSASSGGYMKGEIAACNLVEVGEPVKPGEPKWGRITGGRFAGKWIYLGHTREVKPGQDNLRYFLVTSETLSVRSAARRVDPKLGSFKRGDVLPIKDVDRAGEEVEPGERVWGNIAYGPYENQWVYLGFATERRPS